MKSAAKLILSPLAEEDLIEIGSFIARDDKARAFAFIRELRKFMQVVADAPGIGRIRFDLLVEPHSIVFRRHPYVVFYEPLVKEKGIRVLRVLHGARDHAQIFGPH